MKLSRELAAKPKETRKHLRFLDTAVEVFACGMLRLFSFVAWLLIGGLMLVSMVKAEIWRLRA